MIGLGKTHLTYTYHINITGTCDNLSLEHCPCQPFTRALLVPTALSQILHVQFRGFLQNLPKNQSPQHTTVDLWSNLRTKTQKIKMKGQHFDSNIGFVSRSRIQKRKINFNFKLKSYHSSIDEQLPAHWRATKQKRKMKCSNHSMGETDLLRQQIRKMIWIHINKLI